MPLPHFAAVEAGGTKFLCALVNDRDAVLAQTQIATSDPDTTFNEMRAFFQSAIAQHGQPVSTGLATFGPVDLDPQSQHYGCIQGTPKLGWDGANIRGALMEATGTPVAIETDVNAAALAEGHNGAAQDLSNYAYVTVGTGIGVGIVAGNAVLPALPHTEVGHIRVPHARGDDFAGICRYHGDCLEGLASGPAMKARWGEDAAGLAADHPAWTVASHYLAALCVNLTYMVRCERIILGGGVMNAPHLIARIRTNFSAMMAGYACGPFASDPESYIAPPKLLDPSPGLQGAVLLARTIADNYAR